MSNEGDLKALYPFLHGKPQEPEKLDAALLHSVEEKARDSRETNARFFGDAGADPRRRRQGASPTSIARGGRLFSMGNGGSSCDASHVAVEFVHPITAGRPALAAINLVADLAMISAVGNDVGFEHVFVRQVIAQGKAGDGLIGISTSGNSANLISAFAKAKEMGIATIGLAGGDGGKMKSCGVVDHLPGRADDLDPPHPGMPCRRLSHSLGSRAHAARRRPRLGDDQGSRGMKYLDEFRDSAKAGILVKEIEALVSTMTIPDDRPLHIMEVCGGHTHSIFRYGVEGMLPKEIELVHGPGCPVCVLPMGRVDDCVAIAERPDVIFTTFGDAMRVPGSKKSLLQAKADGADVRMVYSPMDALALARKNPDREVVFFGLGFETTMPSTALTILQAESDGIANFSVFCNHITIVPTIKAILDSPGPAGSTAFSARPCLDGDRHRALRVHRQFLSQADGRRRLRAARHPAIDLDGAEADQGRPRRDREPICAHRPGRRQCAGACRRCRASTSCANSSNGAASDRSIIPASSCATTTPTSTPSGSSRFRTSRSPIPSPASAAKCSRASSSRGSARCSARPARRRRRSAR